MVLDVMAEEPRSGYDTSRREKSTRSTYQREFKSGNISALNPAPGREMVLAGPGANFMTKIKRVAVTFVVPSSSASLTGWLGFLRQPDGLTLANDQDFGDAAVLRPVPFVSNPDNASYWTAYLPAVNLVGTGALWMVAYRELGTNTSLDYVLRYVEERGV